MTDRPHIPRLREYSCEAMGSRFELAFHEADEVQARSLAGEAFALLGQIEGELSRFRRDSDIARINAAPGGRTIRVGPSACQCLRIAEEVNLLTGGAFDVAFAGGSGESDVPGWALQRESNAVTLLEDGIELDLGGIGKGYALDEMAEQLRLWGVESALLHGGSSTALGLGRRSDGSWPVGMRAGGESIAGRTIFLDDRALSGSGIEQAGEHVIDPRTGRAVSHHRCAWALTGSAALADALSTALLVMEADRIEALVRSQPGVAAAVLPNVEGASLRSFGDWGG